MVEAITRVQARIETTRDLAARLPSLTGVVAVPRLQGWASRAFTELQMVVRGAFMRAITVHDERKEIFGRDLQYQLDDVKGRSRGHAARNGVLDVSKAWCIANRHEPAALEALVSNKNVPLDGALVSMVIDTSTKFGEMGLSRVLGALATRLLQPASAKEFPEGVSRILEASHSIAWEAPVHEVIASSICKLDKMLYTEMNAADREDFEEAIGVKLPDLIGFYVNHPRITVLEEVARNTDRRDSLLGIAQRAMDVYEVEPRMTYRLVAALAENQCTSAEILHPFKDAALWTQGDHERKALNALLNRSMGVPVATGSHSPSFNP